MARRNAYVLEHFETGHPTIVGVFSSRRKAEESLKGLPKDIEYALYQLPLNTVLTEGKRLRDQQGLFEHWHYGVMEVEVFDVDEEGRVVESRHETHIEWPD